MFYVAIPLHWFKREWAKLDRYERNGFVWSMIWFVFWCAICYFGEKSP